MKNRHKLASALAALSMFLTSAANALIGGTIDANTTSSDWAGVVSITPAGGGVYSGALIGRDYVLTAAHVAAGFVNNPGSLTINVNYGGNLTQQITASQIFVHPDFRTGSTINNGGVWNDDIALIRLSQPATLGVPVYSLFDAALGTGPGGDPRLNGSPVNVTMVAYGGYADGVSPTVQSGPNAAVKRVGENRLESLYAADSETSGMPPPAGANEGFVFVFDAANAAHHLPGEAGYSGGDSGSPVFVNDNGVWRILGVAAFNGVPQSTANNNSIQFGAVGGGMLIAPYAGWIQAQMAAPVPEPQAYALMLAGLGLVGMACWRRARRQTVAWIEPKA